MSDSVAQVAAYLGAAVSGACALVTLMITIATFSSRKKGPPVPQAPTGHAPVTHTALTTIGAVCAVAGFAFAATLVLNGLPANSPSMNSGGTVQAVRLAALCLAVVATAAATFHIVLATHKQWPTDPKISRLAVLTGLIVTIGVALIA